jgi:probable HAF family extracellular repeat protein
VAGYSTLENGDYHPFLWSHGHMTDLGSLGGAFSLSVALNEHGQVAGYSGIPSGSFHAFRWSQGQMTDLGTLGGRTVKVPGSTAAAKWLVYRTLARAPSTRSSGVPTERACPDLSISARRFRMRLSGTGHR